MIRRCTNSAIWIYFKSINPKEKIATNPVKKVFLQKNYYKRKKTFKTQT